MIYPLNLLLKGSWDFPGCPVVKNPPGNPGTRVESLDQEDPIGHRATKLTCHSYWLLPLALHKRGHCSKKPSLHNEE